MVDLVMSKTEIRKEVGKRIAELTDAEKVSAAQRIKDLIVRIKEFIKAKTVMVYLAKADEVDTSPLIDEARAEGKEVVVPVVEGDNLRVCRLTKELEKSDLGILEPVKRDQIDMEDIDLVIVPGRAFAPTGQRIGRGKGYYDRFLSGLDKNVSTIGICFSCQMFPVLPVSEQDKEVSAVISA